MRKDTIYNLSDDELILARLKSTDRNRLIFAVLLKYFQLEGHYPNHIKYVDSMMLNCIANQLFISPSIIKDFDFEGRSTERFRQEIRLLLGYRKATLKDVDQLKIWLIGNVFPIAAKKSQQIEFAYEYFRSNRMEPFTSKELERHINSAHQIFETKLFHSILNALSDTTKETIDLLLSDDEVSEDEPDNISNVKFKHIKHDIPGAKLKNVVFAIEKIDFLRQLKFPLQLLSNLSEKLMKKYYTRVMAELPGSLLEYKEPIRYAMLAIFCYHRSQILTDQLADLFMKLIHGMRTSAENAIDKKILSEVKRVDGKFDILCTLAEISFQNPAGIIQEKIYPSVGKEKLGDIIKDINSRGKWYENQVNNKIRSLYSYASRKMLLQLLDAFSFKTDSNDNQPLLDAIEFIKTHRDVSGRYYPADIKIPIKNVISSEWNNLVIVDENGIRNIVRQNYEIAVFLELRKRLTCKTIWIEGAHRYRNPIDDLPKDFDDNQEYYYDLLGLPLNADEFIYPRKQTLHDYLKKLNDTIPSNKKVKIINRNCGHIKISPYEPQAESVNLKKLHEAIKKEYGTINLIDILKEVELEIKFTEKLQTKASRKNLEKEVLRYRLLLCLYAIGTNTGLKCISSANDNAQYSELRYVKRRFLTVDNVRQAIVEIINKILEIRDPRIWGTATTGVACDSKKLSVWDQNLMVEFHARYKGRGVMVYWHVEKKALCIYSQLKTCSSSEVGSMIKGILDHCTNMEIDKAYVDTHGQSTLAFGVSEFLAFDLLPRLKNIHSQKLYFPSQNQRSEYKNLDIILKEPINWKIIKENYHEAVKHIVAIKIGTMEADVFVKRFSKDNYRHPVYKAIIEIGKVAKTIFLCRYLMEEELRIEIHEAQNVVERLNSIMGFIFYGKMGEISTNIKTDQELSIVCLHLLQASMAYVNTIIFQNVLSRPEWENALIQEDKRALNVLFHSHINPYGLFPLDLQKRLGIMENDSDNDLTETTKEEHTEELAESLYD